MSVVAAVRPDSWNFPLLVHVAGAMILVGGLLSGTSVLAYARRDERFLRLGYWSLVVIAFPGWILMRLGAQWIAAKEHLDDLPRDLEPTWFSIGGAVADVGGAILLVSLLVGGFGVYRLREGRGSGLLRATLVLSLVLLAAYLVAVWAMAGKPD
jgi:uncharacterized membrane protein